MEKFKKIMKVYSNWHPSKLVLTIILLFPFLYFAISKFELDNDFWFLINTGKEILKKGFITIEPFSIHENFTFMSQQWLSSIIFYFIYDYFDVYGMLVLILLINCIIIFLLYKLLLLITENKVKVSMILTVIIDFLLLISFVKTRPQIFDIVFFISELYLLELYIHKNNKKVLIFLPVISLLLINFHASIWLMFFVFFVPYFVEWLYFKFFKKDTFKLNPLVIAFLISLLVGLINPYGINAITYLFRSYGVDYINHLIGEMKAVTISDNILTYGFVFFVFYSYYYNKKQNKLRYLLLFLGTTYLGLCHYRGLLFLYIVSGISLGYNFRNIFKERNHCLKLTIGNKFVYSVIIISMIVFVSLNIKIKTEKDYILYDVANFLDQNILDKNIKIYTGYNDGGYLEYRGYRCYIDPRAEVFLKTNNGKEDIMLEYYNLQSALLNYKDFLNKYKFEYVLLANNDIMYLYLDELDSYQKIYEKKNSKDVSHVLYKRVSDENN